MGAYISLFAANAGAPTGGRRHAGHRTGEGGAVFRAHSHFSAPRKPGYQHINIIICSRRVTTFPRQRPRISAARPLQDPAYVCAYIYARQRTIHSLHPGSLGQAFIAFPSFPASWTEPGLRRICAASCSAQLLVDVCAVSVMRFGAAGRMYHRVCLESRLYGVHQPMRLTPKAQL